VVSIDPRVEVGDGRACADNRAKDAGGIAVFVPVKLDPATKSASSLQGPHHSAATLRWMSLMGSPLMTFGRPFCIGS
jgi:hypothetical protein